MSLRVAFYSHNGFGLGHVRRNLTLARGLLEGRPDADVMVITGSAGLHETPPPGIDIVKLPSVRKQATGRWRPHSLDIDMERLVSLRRTIILEAVRAYRPHLFVADFIPQGVEGELLPALEELSGRSDARTVIGFRDILDRPETVRHAWERDGTVEVLEKLYDQVLVFGEPDWFDVSQYGVRSSLLHYVGLLGDPSAAPVSNPDGVRRMVVTCGGGADGYPVLAAALESIESLPAELRRSLKCTVLTGPLMTEAEDARLRAVARRIGELGVAAHVHRFADDFKKKLAEAAVVVAMAGYNTVCDLLSFRRPSLLVPRPGPSQEQPMRASILASRGLAANLPLAECTGRAMAAHLEPLFDDRPYPVDAVPFLGGVDRAVRSLLDLVEA